MNQERQSHDPRRDFFRPIAVERYERPYESDSPEQLVRWRPGFLVAAALIAACTLGLLGLLA